MIRILFSAWLVLQASPALSQSNPACDSMVYVQNAKASLGIRVLGAAITDFRLAGSALNPFTWQVPLADMPVNNRAGAPFRGHFLCLGRWGAPTAGEMAAGMPHNGEAGNKCWQPGVHTNPLQLNMQVRAPMDGMEVKRQVWMDPQSPVVKVTEEVTSIATFARPFNMVQHSTIGPPFLDTTTLVDCNAAEGFLQSMSTSFSPSRRTVLQAGAVARGRWDLP
ncbi:MAG: hypothetical protein MUF29_09150 [Chitinophagaceae bacterium]|nr:hypothetical protein [Chitinophagaceae bacterium]